MSNLQGLLVTFHDTQVQLTDADENRTLRKKRDIVLERLRENVPGFDFFNQGSYAMGTGIVPLDGDFDIDVGLVFNDAAQISPKELKRRVYNAVRLPNQEPEWRRHCVRVQWVKAGEPRFHVDLAVYRANGDRLELAVGKEHSEAAQTLYLPSDPKGLIKRVQDYGTPETRLQLRRVVRLLKRWKDLHFSAQGNARPVGVAFTTYALHHLRPVVGDDAATLQSLVAAMIADGSSGRIRALLPVNPGNDTFERMSDEQTGQLVRRLRILLNAIGMAREGVHAPLKAELGIR